MLEGDANRERLIAAVCTKLEHMDFEIKQKLHTSEPGIDITPVRDGFTLLIEATCETSTLKSFSRFGKPFDQNQIKNHIGKALLAVSKLASKYQDSNRDGIAIAHPDNNGHRQVIGEIEYALKKLGVYVFWVKDSIQSRLC